ncbi:MAG: histidinol phosphatase [Cryobacterium sp.]|nr:histidinol phosphatase [Cryobacterium sp.]
MGVILEAISFSIGGNQILNEVSAVLPPGAVVGLLGPNGAGKSTLLRLIAGIETPDSGSISQGGVSLASLPRREAARRIALLEQNAAPGVDLSVEEVVLLGRIPHRSRILGNFSGDDDRRVAADALAAVGASDLAERAWHTLSGGQQQRVQIARALAQQPALLLLDEPTNHLDISAQLSLLALVRTQVRELGLTAVAALHDLNLAAAHCDHLLLLDGGRVVASGSPLDVLTPGRIADVYGVDCAVIPHPRGGHPVIIFSPEPSPLLLRTES